MQRWCQFDEKRCVRCESFFLAQLIVKHYDKSDQFLEHAALYHYEFILHFILYVIFLLLINQFLTVATLCLEKSHLFICPNFLIRPPISIFYGATSINFNQFI